MIKKKWACEVAKQQINVSVVGTQASAIASLIQPLPKKQIMMCVVVVQLD